MYVYIKSESTCSPLSPYFHVQSAPTVNIQLLNSRSDGIKIQHLNIQTVNHLPTIQQGIRFAQMRERIYYVVTASRAAWDTVCVYARAGPLSETAATHRGLCGGCRACSSRSHARRVLAARCRTVGNGGEKQSTETSHIGVTRWREVTRRARPSHHVWHRLAELNPDWD